MSNIIIFNNNFVNLKPKPIKDVCITTSSHKVSSSSSESPTEQNAIDSSTNLIAAAVITIDSSSMKINNEISEQDQSEESCFPEFRKHIVPDEHKTYSLSELIWIVHRERSNTLTQHEANEYDE